MSVQRTVLITGARKGIGEYLANYYLEKEYFVFGCSRKPSEIEHLNYEHHCLDITEEKAVRKMFSSISKRYGKLDFLLNNAGIALMNHSLLTPLESASKIFDTNVLGTFLFCREAAKLMKKSGSGRIVNFTSVAVPLKIEGEALYAASKAAVETLTQILSKELSPYKITVNALGPTPIRTDLIRNVPEKKLEELLERQAIKRFGELEDVSNVVDFFLQDQSRFITGQTIYLGGV